MGSEIRLGDQLGEEEEKILRFLVWTKGSNGAP